MCRSTYVFDLQYVGSHVLLLCMCTILNVKRLDAAMSERTPQQKACKVKNARGDEKRST